jgi:3-oxoacyl-[acyl-carrier protein] reductase
MNETSRTIIVTGATRGLGLSIAVRLQEAGFRVVATGRTCSDALSPLLHPSNGKAPAFFEPLELGDIENVPKAGLDIARKYGPIYGLVNNAAVGRDGILATLHHSQIIESIQVNVTGTILFTKAILRSMLAGRSGGRIINISSIVSNTGYNGLSVYAATKAAMLGFTRSLARETGAAGITVNSVLPGYMETDMSAGLGTDQMASIRRRSPIGRLAETRDVAHMVSFLMSEEAAAITGTSLTVDAGTTA